jgi:hypothetical protein
MMQLPPIWSTSRPTRRIAADWIALASGGFAQLRL